MHFQEKDLKFIKERGSDPSIVEHQLNRFNSGFPFSKVIEPATVSNGIMALREEEKKEMADLFDSDKGDFQICRFIPASGAATRMFKELFALRDELKGKSRQKQLEYIRNTTINEKFFNVLAQYPFCQEMNIEGEESPDKIIDLLLGDKGLNYGSLPKGLISFHNYGEISRTAFEEHLHESARIIGENSVVRIHFTVSEEHLGGFKSVEKSVVPALENAYNVSFEISYSFQKKSTDTIAVDMNNEPFRDQEGNLVFRPGGHGALIENLNDLESDIVFI
ncbi:MAG TPA: DUF4301 family protein, partial [Bacteroidales bacterium]|nr:DUF4301 family protein [Bacteroidales bacterium]